MRFERTITTTTVESVWLDVPDDVEIDGMDSADLDDLVNDLIVGQAPQWDEEVIDVLDSTAWKEA